MKWRDGCYCDHCDRARTAHHERVHRWVMLVGGLLVALSLGSLLAFALVSIWSNEPTPAQVSR